MNLSVAHGVQQSKIFHIILTAFTFWFQVVCVPFLPFYCLHDTGLYSIYDSDDFIPYYGVPS